MNTSRMLRGLEQKSNQDKNTYCRRYNKDFKLFLSNCPSPIQVKVVLDCQDIFSDSATSDIVLDN